MSIQQLAIDIMDRSLESFQKSPHLLIYIFFFYNSRTVCRCPNQESCIKLAAMNTCVHMYIVCYIYKERVQNINDRAYISMNVDIKTNSYYTTWKLIILKTKKNKLKILKLNKKIINLKK